MLQSARVNGDWIPPGHLITGAGREEVMKKGGGEEARSVRCMCDVCGKDPVAASKQFRRSRGEKSTRLGLVALTVGPVHVHMRASKERASEGSVCGERYFVGLHVSVSVFSSLRKRLHSEVYYSWY